MHPTADTDDVMFLRGVAALMSEESDGAAAEARARGRAASPVPGAVVSAARGEVCGLPRPGRSEGGDGVGVARGAPSTASLQRGLRGGQRRREEGAGGTASGSWGGRRRAS
jgi:hypothetical protein